MSTWMRSLLPGLLLLPLAAQVPAVPDAPFFRQDPKVLAAHCSDEAQRLMRPKDGHLWAEIGDMWLTRGDRPKAEEAFAKALASGFNDPQTRRLIAYAWIRHGHAAQALEAYDACVKVDLSGRYENRKNLYARAAEDLVAHGQAPRAVEYMEQSFRLDSRDEHNFLGFARAALKAGRRDLAAQWLSRAVKVAGDDVDTWMEISDMFLAVNPPRPQLP